MSYLINAFDLCGRLQYFHIQSNARDFSNEQSAAIRFRYVPQELDLPTEMSVITALLPTHIAAFGGTDDDGDKWIVNIERAPAIGGNLLGYLANRSQRLYTDTGIAAEIYLSEAELRTIYAEAGAGPETEQIGFTSLLIGLQAEAFGYPLTDVVDNMNAQCAFPNDVEHDCDGSFFGDIGAAWVHKVLHSPATDEADEGVDAADESDGLPGEIVLANPDGSQWTYTPYHGDQYSPGETGWILIITGTRELDPQPVSLIDMLGDFESMGLADTTAPELAILLTEEMAESLRAGHVAAKKHGNESTAAQRLTQIEAELAEARGLGEGSASPGGDESSGSEDRLELPLMRPLEGQSDQEFLDDLVSSFRGFIDGIKDLEPAPEAAEERSAQADSQRRRQEQNLSREQESGGDVTSESSAPVVDEGDDKEQPR